MICQNVNHNLSSIDVNSVDCLDSLKCLIDAGGDEKDKLYYMLGNAYRRRGDFSAALNCYLEAVAINPDSPAKVAHDMLMNIIEFYHKDYYNT